MKTIKKLLCTLVALTLVFCSLSAGMTVSASNTKKDLKAFKSITIGGRKVKDSEILEDYEFESSTRKPKVKVKVASGWKLKKITFNHGEGTKNQKIKNGGRIKLKGVFENYLTITAKKGSKTAKIELCVYNED